MVAQIPTPLMAPKTRVSSTKKRLCLFTRSRSRASPVRLARISVSTSHNPPPTAKWETNTCSTDTTAISTPPPMGSSQTG